MKRSNFSRLTAVCILFLGLSLVPAMAQDDAVPSGPALSESEIIILLQAKVALSNIEKFVSVRGVSFVCTKDTSKKILAAGGNVSLIGTINLNQKEDLPPLVASVSANGKKKK